MAFKAFDFSLRGVQILCILFVHLLFCNHQNGIVDQILCPFYSHNSDFYVLPSI
ncbi:unnamed protein product [Albugo candida]|uniref:Uncharacterized protein n=1 Tax=Albugo candida TaxID=65357 RepID=A0A024GVH1_9STRA|nr:unnamed protein product [Albugo candida]|eukprot:CCI50779.1 unnamed protein product [Albugo candida]